MLLLLSFIEHQEHLSDRIVIVCTIIWLISIYLSLFLSLSPSLHKQTHMHRYTHIYIYNWKLTKLWWYLLINEGLRKSISSMGFLLVFIMSLCRFLVPHFCEWYEWNGVLESHWLQTLITHDVIYLPPTVITTLMEWKNDRIIMFVIEFVIQRDYILVNNESCCGTGEKGNEMDKDIRKDI